MKRTKKQKTPAKKAVTKKSAIIAQCVVYAQSMGAHHAGFTVDHTGNSDHAGCQALGGEYIGSADQALRKLVGLSPAAGKPPLSRDELFAKAGVLGIMANAGGSFQPRPDEQVFVRFFAAEVEQYLRAKGGAS